MNPELAVVLELEAQRCRLLEAGDLDALSALLDPDLVYVHATGLVQRRGQWLDHLRTSVRFKAIERCQLECRDVRDVILMTGLMRIAGERCQTGETFESTSFVSQVWLQRSGGNWTLALLQSTKVDEAARARALKSSGA